MKREKQQAVITGSSLIDDGILDGDCVIVRLTFERYELTPGRLVAVLTPYGLLVKHIYVTLDDHVRLVSANPAFEDMVLEPEEVTVQGIAVRIERDL
jgi:SOS-response transcriptional repressor LexA